uniref:P-type conjugative transfer protein TrbJ n=1 Tax=uncultured Sphingomonas sp. TaxID=158754 RepID=UPI0035CA2EB2
MTPRARLSRSLLHRLASSTLALTIAGGLTLSIPVQPALAQWTVFDPTNYSQNLLTAARSLQQINNQIQSLQNQATMLTNMARNLSRIDFPELQALRATLQQIDTLMGQAKAIEYRVDHVDTEFRQMFPTSFNAALTSNDHVAAAKARLDASMSAYQETMGVQAQIVANVTADAGTLSALTAKSQSAEGALEAAQATNQLLALIAKQQFQLQNLMVSQGRAEALDQARRVQSQADSGAATTKFLGSGSAYTPR